MIIIIIIHSLIILAICICEWVWNAAEYCCYGVCWPPIPSTLLKYTVLKHILLKCTLLKIHLTEIHFTEIHLIEIHLTELHLTELHLTEMHLTEIENLSDTNIYLFLSSGWLENNVLSLIQCQIRRRMSYPLSTAQSLILCIVPPIPRRSVQFIPLLDHPFLMRSFSNHTCSLAAFGAG